MNKLEQERQGFLKIFVFFLVICMTVIVTRPKSSVNSPSTEESAAPLTTGVQEELQQTQGQPVAVGLDRKSSDREQESQSGMLKTLTTESFQDLQDLKTDAVIEQGQINTEHKIQESSFLKDAGRIVLPEQASLSDKPFELVDETEKGRESIGVAEFDIARDIDPIKENLADKILKKERMIDFKVLHQNQRSKDTFCKIEELGIQFACDMKWKVTEEDHKNLVVISEDPLITMSYGKMHSNFVMIEQLTKMFFKEKGFYCDGFLTENVKFAGRKAVLVKAFSQKDPQIRQVDYFYVHNNNLYGVNFALYPKERWEDGKFIIKKLVDSFHSLTNGDDANPVYEVTKN